MTAEAVATPVVAGLRVLILLAFVAAAHDDYRVGRISVDLWLLAMLGGVVALIIEVHVIGVSYPPHFMLFFVAAVALDYLNKWLNFIGPADTKALVALAIAFPRLGLWAAVVGVAFTFGYPLATLIRNLRRRGEFEFRRERLTKSRLATARGILSTSGLDLDALRWFLRWRDGADGEDGAVAFDERDDRRRILDLTPAARDDVEAFVDDVGEPFGATPERLRAGIMEVATSFVLDVRPAFPFIVPLTLGLITVLLAAAGGIL